MVKGTIRWYDPNKGFGFIIPDEGGKDVYVQGINTEPPDVELKDFDRVEYEMVLGRKGPEAVHVHLVE